VHGADSEEIKRPITPQPGEDVIVTNGGNKAEETKKKDDDNDDDDHGGKKETGGATAVMTPADEMREGLFPDAAERAFACGICEESVGVWTERAASYYCVSCVQLDICESCMRDKLARERGEKEPDYRVVCPAGHRHVRGPVDGWRGVRNGRFRIGEDEIPVKKWIADLEVKWAAYWRDYWTEKPEC
jgi:hypothetical protein